MVIQIHHSDKPLALTIEADLAQGPFEPVPGLEIDSSNLQRLCSFGASMDAVLELLELAYSFAVAGDCITVGRFTYTINNTCGFTA